MKNRPQSVLYLLTSLNTTGGTTSKIKSTLSYTKYKVFIAANYNPEDYTVVLPWEEYHNVQLINIPSRTKIFKIVGKLNKVIRKENIGIVHAFFPAEIYVAFLLKILNPKIKIIRSFEGCVNRNKAIVILSKAILPYFDKIIFISNYVRDFYSDITLKCKNKEVIDNAANFTVAFRNREKDNVCKIVSVAGLNIMKNVFMYAEIGKVLKDRNFPFIMHIVGDGPLRNELQCLIDKYEISEHVKLEGYKLDPKPYYESGYIYIHPADKEGFGIVVAEAMSTGLPVIVANKGGVQELVNHMHDGIIADAYNAEEWADAIIQLYNDKELYIKFSKNGYDTYKSKYTPEIFAKNLDNVYDSLLGKNI